VRTVALGANPRPNYSRSEGLMTSKIEIRYLKTALLRGYAVLKRLWERDLVPQDLELHYFLHWFVVFDGNIVQTAKELKIHRNTIANYFRRFGFSKKVIRLRNDFRELESKTGIMGFEETFFYYYQQFNQLTRLNRYENKQLVHLWQTRFAIKTLNAHYLLWALRAGKDKNWIHEKLDFSERNCNHLLVSVLDSKKRDGFWLAPLKPSRNEIYKRNRSNETLKLNKSSLKKKSAKKLVKTPAEPGVSAG
jgi:hypothetical protein